MAEPYLSEIRIFSFGFPPKGWATCSGQLLPINQNQALFSLLGTTYGGNGQTTFALPDFRGRVPVHSGQGPGLSGRTLGERGGGESHTLVQGELPQHAHPVSVVNRPGNAAAPVNNFFAAHRGGYASSAGTTLSPATASTVGGSQPHANMPPIHVLNFCIALQGIFPSPS